MNRIKTFIKNTPVLGTLATKTNGLFIKKSGFKNSKDYWIKRYSDGRNSGAGSYDKFAEFKAEVINDFVREKQINKVIELGCGDGNQLKYFNFKEYIGFDISQKALDICKENFKKHPSYTFILMDDYSNQKADLSMSLDVIYHLIEEDVFNEYMTRMFQCSNKYVIIYASNSTELNPVSVPSVKHRKFSDWVEANQQQFSLVNKILNKHPFTGDFLEGSFSDFYIYERNAN